MATLCKLFEEVWMAYIVNEVLNEYMSGNIMLDDCLRGHMPLYILTFFGFCKYKFNNVWTIETIDEWKERKKMSPDPVILKILIGAREKGINLLQDEPKAKL